MRDTAVVESIVAGDSGGLAAAYDEYADLIYAYCRAMLGDQEETADAVQGTFVNAAANAHRLHDASKLRAWLFALARNQCMHARRHSQAAVLDTGALSMAAGSDSDRAVLRAAIDGLSAGEWDILTLLWHGLDIDEAALILGLSRNEAYSRFSRARDQLETSVGVLLVCYHGRHDCPGLDGVLGEWDGGLTERLRDTAAHHIEGCDTCAGCRDRQLRPALLLNLTPGALLGAAEEARAMSRPAPPWLRDRLLWLVTTDDPRAEAERRAMDRRLAPFGSTGFPRPRRTTRALAPGPARLRLILGGAGGLAAVAAVVALIAIPSGSPAPARSGSDAAAGTGSAFRSGGAISPGTGQSAAPSVSPSSSGRPSPTRHRPSSPAPGNSAAVVSSQAPPLATPQPPAPGAVQGTLSESPSSITVVAPFASRVTITAQGGPVNWSVSVPSAAAGQIGVSPSSGTLSAGQSATISVSAENANSFKTTLTISPGGHQVSVTVGLG
jgi:RNA polymerase sigma factor (sigma-70 family)